MLDIDIVYGQLLILKKRMDKAEQRAKPLEFDLARDKVEDIIEIIKRFQDDISLPRKGGDYDSMRL